MAGRAARVLLSQMWGNLASESRKIPPQTPLNGVKSAISEHLPQQCPGYRRGCQTQSCTSHRMSYFSLVKADACRFGIGSGFRRVCAPHCHLQDLGQVKRATQCALGDLFTTAEAVADDQPVRRSLTDSG